MTRVTIIGLGLIGGSLALDLKSQLNISVTGVDNNPSNLQLASELNLVDKVQSLDDSLVNADIVIIAIPVDSIEDLLPQILDKVNETTVVLDVGSTKTDICKAVRSHPNRRQYVAAHPLAGTEYSGPQAAITGLFRGKKNIICDKELSDPEAVTLTTKLFNSIGMQTYYLSSESHDKHLAYVSHLSHITSFTLSLTVLDIEKDDEQILNLASTGFDSTVRLAKSNPKTWTPILVKNNEHLSLAIGQYIEHLQEFKRALEQEDRAHTEALMLKANTIKHLLNKSEKL